MQRSLSAIVIFSGVALTVSCEETSTPESAPAASVSPKASTSASAERPASTRPSNAEVDAGFPHPKAKTQGCVDGMVRVQGDY